MASLVGRPQPSYQDAFNAGAAAMAELFAAGHGVRVEQMPRRYHVTCDITQHLPDSTGRDPKVETRRFVDHVLWAYSRTEAMQECGNFEGKGLVDPAVSWKCEPAHDGQGVKWTIHHLLSATAAG